LETLWPQDSVDVWYEQYRRKLFSKKFARAANIQYGIFDACWWTGAAARCTVRATPQPGHNN
jgi:hypothetical protein